MNSSAIASVSLLVYYQVPFNNFQFNNFDWVLFLKPISKHTNVMSKKIDTNN